MNTRLDLEYRDASNYRANASVVVKGEITQEMICHIDQNLEDGMFIISHQVGLPTPAERLHGEYGGADEDDHVFTALEEWEDGDLPSVEDLLTCDAPTIDMTVDVLAQKIGSAYWDVGAEMIRQDLPV